MPRSRALNGSPMGRGRAATREMRTVATSAAVDPAALAALPLFHDMPLAQLAALGAALRSRKLGRGVHLISAEEPGERAYIILSGTVRVYRDRTDGTEVILAI